MRVLLSLLCLYGSLFGQLCSGNPTPKSFCAGWEALQQLRSLIPERVWGQEFDLVVDTKAFHKAIPHWISSDRKPVPYILAESNHYFLQATMSGETVGIIDRYAEFLWSPYWDYPPRLEDLEALEKQIVKENPAP